MEVLFFMVASMVATLPAGYGLRTAYSHDGGYNSGSEAFEATHARYEQAAPVVEEGSETDNAMNQNQGFQYESEHGVETGVYGLVSGSVGVQDGNHYEKPKVQSFEPYGGAYSDDFLYDNRPVSGSLETDVLNVPRLQSYGNGYRNRDDFRHSPVVNEGGEISSQENQNQAERYGAEYRGYIPAQGPLSVEAENGYEDLREPSIKQQDRGYSDANVPVPAHPNEDMIECHGHPVGYGNRINNEYYSGNILPQPQNVQHYEQQRHSDRYANGAVPDGLEGHISNVLPQPQNYQAYEPERPSDSFTNGAVHHGIKGEVQENVRSFEQQTGDYGGRYGDNYVNGAVHNGLEGQISNVLPQPQNVQAYEPERPSDRYTNGAVYNGIEGKVQTNVQSFEQQLGGQGERHSNSYANDAVPEKLYAQQDDQSLQQHAGDHGSKPTTGGYVNVPVSDGLEGDISEQHFGGTVGKHNNEYVNGPIPDDLKAPVFNIHDQQPRHNNGYANGAIPTRLEAEIPSVVPRQPKVGIHGDDNGPISAALEAEILNLYEQQPRAKSFENHKYVSSPVSDDLEAEILRVVFQHPRENSFGQRDDGQGKDNGPFPEGLEAEILNIQQQRSAKPHKQHVGGEGSNGYANDFLPDGLEGEILNVALRQPRVQSIEQYQNPGHGNDNGPVPDDLVAKILNVQQQHPSVQSFKHHVSGNGGVNGFNGLETEILNIVQLQSKVKSFNQADGGHGDDNGFVPHGLKPEIINEHRQLFKQHVSDLDSKNSPFSDGLETAIINSLLGSQNSGYSDSQQPKLPTTDFSDHIDNGAVRDGIEPEILHILNQQQKVQSLVQQGGGNGLVTDNLDAEILKVVQQHPEVQTIKVIHQQEDVNALKVPHSHPKEAEVKNLRVHERVIDANGHANGDDVVHNVQVIHKKGAGQEGYSGENHNSYVNVNQSGNSGKSHGSHVDENSNGKYVIHSGAGPRVFSARSYSSNADNSFAKTIETLNSLKAIGAIDVEDGSNIVINRH